MAHAIQHAGFNASRPDPKRIAGYTFAILFNLSLLMLLLAVAWARREGAFRWA